MVEVPGNSLYGMAGSGGGSGFSLNFSLGQDLDPLFDLLPFVLGNPESAILAALPLPIIGAPWTPQQVLWRQSLMIAGLSTGVFKGDDQMVIEILSSLGLQPSDQGMWIGPGVEWYV